MKKKYKKIQKKLLELQKLIDEVDEPISFDVSTLHQIVEAGNLSVGRIKFFVEVDEVLGTITTTLSR